MAEKDLIMIVNIREFRDAIASPMGEDALFEEILKLAGEDEAIVLKRFENDPTPIILRPEDRANEQDSINL